LLAVLEDGPLTESELEDRFLALVMRAGLPEPTRQVCLPGTRRRLDFLFPGGLAVEVDGTRFHAPAAQQRRDAEKLTRATLAGMRVLRFTWWDVCERPGWVVECLRLGLRTAFVPIDRIPS